MTRVSLALLLALVATADAKPAVRSSRPIAKRATDPQKLGAHARVAFARAGELRPARDALPRRAEPLTAEEEAASSIQKLLRSSVLRRGVTGLFVVDAKTGEPLFAVNATEAFNPASNVKMISTATSLELLGADFRYPTRVLGPAPEGGIIHGDVYLLGSYDPTLTTTDFHEIAATMARSGITTIDGNVAIGSDPTRDGIYRSLIPIEIVAGEPGQAPAVTPPADFKLFEVHVTATTAKRVQRPRLTIKTEQITTAQGYPRIVLTVGGTIGRGGSMTYPLWTKARTTNAAYALIAALKANGIEVTGEMKTAELGDFIGDTVLRGGLPIELGRHDSEPLADIIRRVNKWSINWLADRVVMTASALARRAEPSMEIALDAMYGWLARHPHVEKTKVTIDTGSGLSYRTQITPTDLVNVVRSAGGFVGDTDPRLADAWLHSLSIAGNDGTLRSRFKNTNASGRMIGKTGTLSTVIALSGILDIDPSRPLAFSLVTNTDSPLSKGLVRRAHEQVLGEICKYLSKTAKTTPTSAPLHAAPTTTPATDAEGEPEDATDAVLDNETAGSQ